MGWGSQKNGKLNHRNNLLGLLAMKSGDNGNRKVPALSHQNDLNGKHRYFGLHFPQVEKDQPTIDDAPNRTEQDVEPAY